MYRSIAESLITWKTSDRRKSLLLRGARQVGKTWTVREFSKNFEQFCEINFEEDSRISSIFSLSLEPNAIVEKLSAYTGVSIIAGKTLLFFDEIQSCPDALRSLRFFYEKLPDLHVVAAGSLLEFALAEMPSFGVGRVQSLFMYPMNFKEFLLANDQINLVNHIESLELYEPIESILFSKLTEYYRNFMLIGGFPAVVNDYIEKKDIMACMAILDELIQGFRDDFAKYQKQIPQLRIDETFSSIASQAGGKFKYSKVNSNLPAYQVRDALELLLLAGLAHKVYHTSAQGLPLHSQINEKKIKIIPCDIGLYQRLHGLDIAELISSDSNELVNKGAAAEIITGTEFISYSSPNRKAQLYYWHKENGSNAEVDYLTVVNDEVIPVEVKSSARGKMQSLRLFLKTHSSSYGIRTALENSSTYGEIRVIPACALFKLYQ